MTDAQVTLLPGQQVVPVKASESILDAALRSGLNLPHSCKGGHCGSCRARIIAGQIHYPLGSPPGITAQEQREGYALLCQARPLTAELTIEVRQSQAPSADIQVRSVPCRIEHMETLAPDVMAVTLRLPRSEDFTFAAGQYIDIMLPGSRRRSFSLANPPHDAKLLELHVRRVRGGEFTQQLFESMKEKALLRIEGPLGQFWFREASPRRALFVGGGTGYAPLRAMLRHLLERGDNRPIELYWGAKSRVDLYAEREVRGWTETSPSLRFVPVLSDPLLEDHWTGRTGLVHAAVLADHPQLDAYDVYAAGPPAMVEAIRHEFTQAGLPADQLFFDSFDYAPDALAKLRAASVVL
jgi:CDP-4-dehydro-6-deoxyglucose reductase, E3